MSLSTVAVILQIAARMGTLVEEKIAVAPTLRALARRDGLRVMANLNPEAVHRIVKANVDIFVMENMYRTALVIKLEADHHREKEIVPFACLGEWVNTQKAETVVNGTFLNVVSLNVENVLMTIVLTFIEVDLPVLLHLRLKAKLKRTLNRRLIFVRHAIAARMGLQSMRTSSEADAMAYRKDTNLIMDCRLGV